MRANMTAHNNDRFRLCSTFDSSCNCLTATCTPLKLRELPIRGDITIFLTHGKYSYHIEAVTHTQTSCVAPPTCVFHYGDTISFIVRIWSRIFVFETIFVLGARRL